MFVFCLVTKSCPSLCDLLDCSPPDSSVHGISQARILEWTAISFNKDFKKWLILKKEEEEAPEDLKPFYSTMDDYYCTSDSFESLSWYWREWLVVVFRQRVERKVREWGTLIPRDTRENSCFSFPTNKLHRDRQVWWQWCFFCPPCQS